MTKTSYFYDVGFFVTIVLTAKSEEHSEDIIHNVIDGFEIDLPNPNAPEENITGTIEVESIEAMNDALDDAPEDDIPQVGLHKRAMDVKAFVMLEVQATSEKEAEAAINAALDGTDILFGTHAEGNVIKGTLQVESLDIQEDDENDDDDEDDESNDD